MRILFTLTLSLFFLLKGNSQTTYEAENAEDIYNGEIETEHIGYSGSGYVNGDNDLNNHTEWAVTMVSSGEQTITVYYANGSTDNRDMTLTINGDTVQEVSCPSTGAWTTYGTTSLNAPFTEGLNLVRLSATSATSGGPNLDKITITGEQEVAQYKKVTLTANGGGNVTISPEQDYYAVGAEVQLIASATESTWFAGWIGNKESKSDTLLYTIDTVNYLTAVFMPYNVFANTDELVGWASYIINTTGGEGGDTTYVSTQAELIDAVRGDEPKIVLVDTTIQFSPVGKEISIGSKTTLAGVEDKAILLGCEIRINGVNNVILRDLTIKDAYVSWDGKETDYDAIEVNNSQFVWITHCDLSHYDDGLCDIKNASNYVTVSWCHFHNHNKVMLIGSGDAIETDEGQLNVSVHHNWFDGRYDNGVWRRLPLCRYGKIHVFNNYFDQIANSCIEGNYSANVVVDNNYFYKSESPHALVSGVGGHGDNKMSASGNIYDQSGSRRDKGGSVFSPSQYYDYDYHNTENIPAIVMLGAGVNKDSLIGKAQTVGFQEEITTVKDANITVATFPNPANELLTISVKAHEASVVSIALFDISGKQVYFSKQNINAGNNRTEINTSTLAAGTYILKVISKERSVSNKVILK